LFSWLKKAEHACVSAFFIIFAVSKSVAMSFFNKLFSKEKKEELNQTLEKSKENFFSKLAKTVVGKSKVDDEVLDNLEEALVSSDVGIQTTLKIIDRIERRVSRDKYIGIAQLNTILREEICELLKENHSTEWSDFELPLLETPYVIVVVGVNGVGKTTTIGKLAYQFKQKGYSVMLGAADTFRAAAVDQLEIWAKRADVPIVLQKMGADPAAVAYDAIASAIAKKCDVVIIDTAGRLHNKANLMRELNKITTVIKKLIPDAPHETLLVLDGSTGQNAVEQVKQFTAVTAVNALAITKLDGTAKGGVVIGISDQFQIPVKYIGVGEKIDQLQIFDKLEFVDSILPKN
jgi:fused signal recognition particle receptor